jgi:hypothetical protein
MVGLKSFRSLSVMTKLDRAKAFSLPNCNIFNGTKFKQTCSNFDSGPSAICLAVQRQNLKWLERLFD